MMSLSLAMALSGLDDWSEDLKGIYNHGLALIDDKNAIINSGRSSSSSTSIESGIDLNLCPTFDINMNNFKKFCDSNNSTANNNLIRKVSFKHVCFLQSNKNHFF